MTRLRILFAIVGTVVFIIPIPSLAALSDLNDQLFRAVKATDINTVKKLLAAGADVNTRDHFDNTPLYIAAHRNCVRISKILIDHHADVNPKNGAGLTPLHIAIMAAITGSSPSHTEVIRLLLIQGADTFIEEGTDKNFLDTALRELETATFINNEQKWVAHLIADIIAQFRHDQRCIKAMELKFIKKIATVYNGHTT